ncbi:MAG: XdhC family protein, partial [Clostridium perfringens]|nr:XdhC family protein [Clostridium perfringens]
MDYKILEEIEKRVLKGEEGALVTITESIGSTPRKVGSIMAVFEKDILGSIGGGIVEFKVINEARELIKIGKSKNFA